MGLFIYEMYKELVIEYIYLFDLYNMYILENI